MKNLKRYGLIAAAAVIVIALAFIFFSRPSSSQAYEVNLLKNGDFSQVDGEGNPVSWYKDAYAGLSGSVFTVETDESGSVAHITNKMPKDARFAQDVAVEPNSLYRLHGYIKASAEGGRGANLSIAGGYYFSELVYDTEGEWQEVTMYGRTGENQHEVSVYVRLGGYSGEATGDAWFKDITLCRVDGIPEGNTSSVWNNVFSSASSDTGDAATDGSASWLLAVSCFIYLAFFVLLCRYLRRPRNSELQEKKTILSSPWLAAALLLCALVLRMVLAALIPGYNVDMGCFRAWANRMASVGPADFYDPADPFSSCDYPPGYMWILGLLGWLGNLLGTGTTEFMVKLPPIAADIALCAILYQYAKKDYVSAPAALALSLLYALNPLVLATGAAWGQADALMTLLLFLTVLYAVRGQWKAALPLYVTAVLFKPQALMFGPLGLITLVMDMLNSRQDKTALSAKLKDVLLGLGFAVIAALVIVVPFSIQQKSWDWLFTLYSQTMGRYAYVTVNACNLYFLLGKNWVAVESGTHGDFWIPVLTLCLTVLPLACAWIGKREALSSQKERRLLLSLGIMSLITILYVTITGLTGQLTYSSLGAFMIVHCVVIIGILYVYGNDLKNLPIFGAALLLMLFNVGAMMHERYLFPAVALLLLGYALKKDVRILWLAVGVTIAGFLNVGCALDRNIRIGGAAGHLNAPAVSLQSDMALWEYASAAMNCTVCFCSLWLCALLSRGECLPLSPEKPNPAPLPEEKPIRKMTRRDWIMMGAITVVYACVTFTNLGSTKAPQTAYVSASPDEQIVLDLGEVRDFQMLYYGGIHQYDSDFTVEISEDGEWYDQYYTAGMKIGECFKWQYLSYTAEGTYPAALHGRYVRITADNYNLTLFETLFQNAETCEVLPVTLLESPADNETAANLIDEPDSMGGSYPNWYNSTYFDEIYHARTAYEHLHQMQPYEYTHPPLGKVMMSWAIAIFGMTPFGWRFAGALAGVLMLPGMYLLGKLLIKRSWGGMAAALLMAFDLMHFTQTRIATIDSFVVLWIIWMVYFMLRWFYQDFFHMPFWKTLIPLGLSGLCMGLAVASKWTGCYAGVALALILFFGIGRRARLVLAARKTMKKKRTEEEKLLADGGKYLILTVLSCLVFFVLVPALVYYCAYIPFFSYDGVGVSVKKIIHEAERMLSYHGQPGLGMDHSFYSPWYEWPVIGKPMWYASNSFEPAGYQSSIMALGNPALWWGGLLCIVVLLGVWIKRHVRKDGSFSLGSNSNDARPALILLMYFVQLMPWILVSRGTYIYHYFPCVPFLALAIVLCLDLLADQGIVPVDETDEAARRMALGRRKRFETVAMILLAVTLIAAAALFIVFFPYASGALAPQRWMDAMKWFSRWLWY